MVKQVLQHGALALLMTVFTAVPGVSYSQKPLDLPWGKQVEKHFNNIKGFNYLYGDVIWGEAVFSGHSETIEAELQLVFSNRYITRAVLILGPAGINGYNCLNEYQQVLKALNKRYGHYEFREVKEDNLVSDLLYSTKCHPYAVGLRETTAYWRTKEFKISASLWGDGEQIFIEIDYIYVAKFKEKKRPILKKL